MLRAFAAMIVLSLVAAGCIAPGADLDTASLGDDLVPALVAHVGNDVVPLSAEWAELAVSLVKTPYRTGEPTVGVTSDGTIFVTSGGADVARSKDNGKSWEQVNDPLVGPRVSLDPWIYVDTATDRLFNAPLYVACTWASWSDDGGDTWDFNPVTGCGIPAHDHQKFTAGPPAEGVSTLGYESVLYYQYNSFRMDGSWVTVSLDGGRTYSPGVNVHPADCHSGIAGPVRVGPEGTAYLAKPACDGLNIAVSRDSGASWEVTGKVNDAGVSPALAVTVDAAVDAAGNAYAVWTGKDGQVYLTRSTDLGASWSPAVRVSPPHLTSTVFTVIQAGDEGRVAIAYLGTTSDASKWRDSQDRETRDAQWATDDAVWQLYTTFADDALAAEPVFTSLQVTPDEDPVQRGCIWQSGGGNPCRNLLDFIGSAQYEGRFYVVFADGCDKCASASDSRGADVVLAIVDVGPSLLGGMLAPLFDAAVIAVQDEAGDADSLLGRVLDLPS